MAGARIHVGGGKRERTRARLVEAALRVVARQGPDASSIDDVAAEAGVARGTFYNHFGTREAMLVGVAIRAAEAAEADLAHLRDFPDPAERLSGALRGYIRRAAADTVWGWAVVRIALIAAPLGEAMRRNLAQDLSEGIATGRFRVPSVQAAQDVVLGAGMTGMRAVLHGEADAGHAEAVAEMVLRGLGVADAAEVARRPLDV